MKQTRKASFIKSLLGTPRRPLSPAKRLQPLDPAQLRQVAGGDGPKGGW